MLRLGKAILFFAFIQSFFRVNAEELPASSDTPEINLSRCKALLGRYGEVRQNGLKPARLELWSPQASTLLSLRWFGADSTFASADFDVTQAGTFNDERKPPGTPKGSSLLEAEDLRVRFSESGRTFTLQYELARSFRAGRSPFPSRISKFFSLRFEGELLHLDIKTSLREGGMLNRRLDPMFSVDHHGTYRYLGPLIPE